MYLIGPTIIDIGIPHIIVIGIIPLGIIILGIDHIITTGIIIITLITTIIIIIEDLKIEIPTTVIEIEWQIPRRKTNNYAKRLS